MTKLYKVALTDTTFIEVESDIPIVVSLLPPSQKNQRPGYYMDAIGICQHENGNPNSNAAAELRYFRSGAEGRQASYHFVGDESAIYQMIPLRENAWHAGDGGSGTGNRKTIAFSIAQGAASFTNARKGMAFFIGKLMKKVGIARDKTYQHYDFSSYKKNCPQWIRNNGWWPEHVALIRAAYDGDDAVVTPPEPSYPAPIQLAALDVTVDIAPRMVTLEDGTECIWVGDRVRATRATPRYQWAGKKAPRIGPDILAGTEFDVDWLFENAEGWWYYTPWDTRIWADDTERIGDTKG